MSSSSSGAAAAAAWHGAASLATARLGHGVAALDGVVYAIGGKGAAGVLQSCEKFDPKVGYWSPDVPDLPPLPGKSPGRYFLVAVEVKGFLWAIGGSNGVGAGIASRVGRRDSMGIAGLMIHSALSFHLRNCIIFECCIVGGCLLVSIYSGEPV